MANISLPRDNNRITVIGGTSSADGTTPVTIYVDPTSHRALVDLAGNGDITIGTSTITGGTNTRILYNNAGVVGEYTLTGTGTVVAMQTAPSFLTSITTPAVLASANDSGAIGASGTAFSDLFLASGAVINFNSGNMTITHAAGSLTVSGGNLLGLGATTATTFNGLTITANGTNTLNITAGKSLVVTNSLTLSGTDSTVMTFPSTSATIARIDAGQTFTGVQVFTSPSITTATLNGANQLAENATIVLDASLGDGGWSGVTRAGTAGATLAFGDLVYLAAADSRWELADADSVTTADRLLGMVVLAAANDGDPTVLLLMGNIRADAAFPAMTIGSAMYVGETAGDIQTAIPTGADNVIRRVGYALTADELYFNPSMDSQVIVA